MESVDKPALDTLCLHKIIYIRIVISDKNEKLTYVALILPIVWVIF